MPSTTTIQTLSPEDKKDLTALGECYIKAFGETPNTVRKEPEPRLPLEERYEGCGLRLARMMRHGAIGWKAVLGNGEVAGAILLNEPGWRNKLVGDEEAKGPAFKGFDVQFYNWFTQDLEDARDKCMPERNYWYIRLLIVHPSHQRQGIGSQLINTLLTHIQNSTKPDLPIVVEPTLAGEATYRARGFTYKAPLKYSNGQPDGQVWVKPGVQN